MITAGAKTVAVYCLRLIAMDSLVSTSVKSSLWSRCEYKERKEKAEEKKGSSRSISYSSSISTQDKRTPLEKLQQALSTISWVQKPCEMELAILCSKVKVVKSRFF